MKNEEIYIDINNKFLCIICLEILNESVINICDNCNIQCHKKCLNNWYKNKKKKICPICLKSKNYYKKKREINIINEETNIINEESDIINEESDIINEESDIINEENVDNEEIINYYLYRQNNSNICYKLIYHFCCSKYTASYILIFILLLYTYSILY